ncbi:peptide deformylase [Clostridia bacterium]|nr:peptide deformylase [Clostridia bacterium]
MALRNLRVDGDSLLRKKSKPVTDITKGVMILLDDMVDTMKHSSGAGLAAPQVGILKRAVVIEHEGTVYEMINPEITDMDGTQRSQEACLSIPGMVGDVERPNKLVVTYTDRKGDEHTMPAEERLAIIVAHEVDHLDGILYKDRATVFRHRKPSDDEEE